MGPAPRTWKKPQPGYKSREQIRSTQDRLFSMNDFGRLVEAEIPRLRRYARALTRDTVRADDLVQSCLARAVAKQICGKQGLICELGFLLSCTISM